MSKQFQTLWVMLFLGVTTFVASASHWGSTNRRYSHVISKDEANTAAKTLSLEGWRGEALQAQLVVENTDKDEALYQIRLSELRNAKGLRLKLDELELGWVDEVLADTFSACGTHELEAYGRFKQADRIVAKPYFLLPRGERRGVWLSLSIPRSAQAGVYSGVVEIRRSGKLTDRLPLKINVSSRQLPEPKDWKFHLDFWQNPYSVARWHGVELWSPAHFDALRPLMLRLARSGQKVITATLINRPWNGQTEDAFGSMIRWTKHRDGRWSYDFDVFDRWVSFMMGCGIDREITCFSMIPWQLSFQYYDEAEGKLLEWTGKPGEAIYAERWGHFLEAFRAHLIAKGWLEKTTIAMDERSLEQMQIAIALIKKHASGLKISMAGNYHPEIEADLYDYCVDEQSPDQYTTEVIKRRRTEGKISTYYTCCSSRYANTFTFSPAAESTFIPWYAIAKGLDGYLRWAYNSWTIDPNYDSRFRAWSSGDTYIVYPNNYSSIRWQKLLEGIQQFEKYHILLAEAQRANDQKRIDALHAIIATIDIKQIDTRVDQIVIEAQRSLNAMR